MNNKDKRKELIKNIIGTILFLIVIGIIIAGEIKVQKRWDDFADKKGAEILYEVEQRESITE